MRVIGCGSGSAKAVGIFCPINPVFIDVNATDLTLTTTTIDARMTAQDDSGEVDSLFGSPPPSPAPESTRGGSPALALPGISCAMQDLPKNVGTIALPGSHNHSELLVSLPGPVSTPQPVESVEQVQQTLPPWRPQTTQFVQEEPRQFRFAEYIGPRAASPPASASTRPKRGKRKKAKSAGSDSTLSPNFLRNNRGLLGRAGLVGGISPANLSFHPRGSNKDNPIVLDEEMQDTSASSRVNPYGTTKASSSSSQAVADALISQGNLLPVLRALMPYFGTSKTGEHPSGRISGQFRFLDELQTNPNIHAPPLKKRKLKYVPAGAKDWDVPYPFPENEGPPNYLEAWRKKRGKKLMMQLVSLVRDAVLKASVKTQLKRDGSDVLETAKEPSDGDVVRSNTPHTMNNAGENVPVLGPPGMPGSTPVTEESLFDPQAAFSDIFSQSGVNADDPVFKFNANFDSLLSAVNDALSDPNIQLTGNDLTAMSSYPFSPEDSASPTMTDSTRLPTPSDSSRPLSSEGKEGDEFNIESVNFDDILPPDSTSLDLPWPDDSIPSVENFLAGSSATTILEGVPNPDPIQNPASNMFTGYDKDVQFEQADAAMDELPRYPTVMTNNVQDDMLEMNTTGPTMTENTETVTVLAPFTAQVQAMEKADVPSLQPELSRPPKNGGTGQTRKKLDKQEVLRRARKRREQLAAELARAKIELWETTIEQAVLTHLSKDKELRQET